MYELDRMLRGMFLGHKLYFMTFEDIYTNSIPDKSFDYIILSHEMEVSNDVVFEDVHKYLRKFSIPENKLVLVMGDCSLSENYKKFVRKNKIKKTINTLNGYFMEICVRQSFGDDYKNKVIKNVKRNLGKLKNKRFITLNGKLKPHREQLINFIEKNNLNKHIDYSVMEYNKPLDNYNFENVNVQKKVNKLYREETNNRVSWHNMKKDQHTDFHINQIYTDSKWWFARKENLLPMYNKYNLDIVTESESNVSDKIFFTEKTLRPLYFGLPFLLMGNEGMLKGLREMGYATYDNIFDESYDTKKNWKSRLRIITSEVKRFCELSDKDFSNEIKKTTDNVLHNVDHFFNNDFQMNKIQQQVSDIVS
tara:strand:+ start:1174 stop:2265 length:1092 start_codon:yes stop_codon:yes gene_type:complete